MAATTRAKHPLLPLLLSFALAFAAGYLGVLAMTPNSMAWYMLLHKPALTPPSWVFAPVWSTLYALMGLAAWLVWRKRDMPGAKLALYVYAGQLVLNALWSLVFFGMQDISTAADIILALLGLIVVTTILFWRVDRRTGMLFLPYVAWVAFASYLNCAILLIN